MTYMMIVVLLGIGIIGAITLVRRARKKSLALYMATNRIAPVASRVDTMPRSPVVAASKRLPVRHSQQSRLPLTSVSQSPTSPRYESSYQDNSFSLGDGLVAAAIVESFSDSSSSYVSSSSTDSSFSGGGGDFGGGGASCDWGSSDSGSSSGSSD